MNSNRLHRIFGGGSNLSREDIKRYGDTKDGHVKNQIESRSLNDSFDNDALEGWEEAGYDTNVMANLDRRFSPRSNSGLYIAGSALLVVTLFIGGYYLLNNDETPIAENETEKITELTAEQEITLDESDLLIPEPIEQMHVAPEKEQIQVAVIKEEFKEKKEQDVPDTPIEIESLPLIAIEIEQNDEQEIVRQHDHAKEIYLYDLKLIDYTKYRSKPTVRTKQVTLSGTPANMESDESEQLDPIWREVNIPYMEYLSKSMKIFGRGQYKRSLTRFETIIETYSADVNANFYGGLCLYNLGEYEQAIKFFNTCILGPYSNFDEEAQWMIALSHEKLGNKQESNKIFTAIIEQNGYYKTQAEKKLK